MALQKEIPALVGKLSSIMGDELAERIVKVATDATANSTDAEAMISDSILSLSNEQRTQAIAVLDNYQV